MNHNLRQLIPLVKPSDIARAVADELEQLAEEMTSTIANDECMEASSRGLGPYDRHAALCTRLGTMLGSSEAAVQRIAHLADLLRRSL